MSVGRVRVVHEADLPWSVSQVWKVVTNVSDWRWRSDLAKCEIINERVFVEHPKGGKPIRFTTIQCENEHVWEFSIESNSLGGYWRGTFTQTRHGCHLQFVEEVQMRNRLIPNWVTRLFLRSYQTRYFQDLHTELRRRYGEQRPFNNC